MGNLTGSTEETLSPAELRNFGLILAGGVIVFFGLLFPLLKGRGVHLLSWPWLVAAVLAAAALVAPKILAPLNRAWLALGHVLGYINTRIILGIIFVLIFIPVAILLRLLGKDPMQRTLDAQLNSYRVDSEQPKPQNLARPY